MPVPGRLQCCIVKPSLPGLHVAMLLVHLLMSMMTHAQIIATHNLFPSFWSGNAAFPLHHSTLADNVVLGIATLGLWGQTVPSKDLHTQAGLIS